MSSCGFPGCSRVNDAGALCSRHWAMLTDDEQAAIRAAWKPRGLLKLRYRFAVARAIQRIQRELKS